MAGLQGKKRECARDVAIIVGGLLLTFAFLFILISIILGVPTLTLLVTLTRMGPAY